MALGEFPLRRSLLLLQTGGRRPQRGQASGLAHHFHPGNSDCPSRKRGRKGDCAEACGLFIVGERACGCFVWRKVTVGGACGKFTELGLLLLKEEGGFLQL